MSEKYLPLSGIKSILRECLPEDEVFEMTELISAVPPADVAPVVHGQWIEELGDVISCRCSRCDHSYNLYEDDINGYPFCAWCGAKMGESEDKNDESV